MVLQTSTRRIWVFVRANSPLPTAYTNLERADCDDDTVDTFLISFLTVYFSMGDMPEIQLANICSNVDNPVFPGTQLPDCSFLEEDIKKCQAKGKIITYVPCGRSMRYLSL